MINKGNASSRKKSCGNAHSVTGVRRSQLKYLISHCYRLELLLFKMMITMRKKKKYNRILMYCEELCVKCFTII